MFCDINSGTGSTLGPKSRPTRSKLQGNLAAWWDNPGSESSRAAPTKLSHQNESPPVAVSPHVAPTYLIRCFLKKNPANTARAYSKGQGSSLGSSQDSKVKPTTLWVEIHMQLLKGGEAQKAACFRAHCVSSCFNGNQDVKLSRVTYPTTSTRYIFYFCILYYMV